MNGKIASSARVSAVSAGMLILGFGLLIVATPRSQMAQPRSPITFWQNNAVTSGSLAVVETDIRDKTILFGDALDLLITIQNRGKKPITIPPDSLILKNEGWSGFPGLGSGLGESPLVRVGVFKKEAFTLQPGESAALTGSNIEMAATTIGPMKADFTIETDDETLQKELGKPPGFSVSYYVAPSKLLASIWSARTAEERHRLQPQIRDLLLLGSKAEEWRDRKYVEGTMMFMGCYVLPYLESAMKDSDPVVRQGAVLALFSLAWNAGELNFFIAHLIKDREGRDWAARVDKCDENHALRESIRLAITGLGDQDPRIRIAAISVLTQRAARESNLRGSREISKRSRESLSDEVRQLYDGIGLVDPALPLIKKLSSDADPGVRSEAQKFLSHYTSQQEVAGGITVSLNDADAGVREQALQALKSSSQPPSLATIEKAFASTKGEVVRGLIELMYEQEDSELAARLSHGFKERTAPERLMILTAIAGHTDDAALRLVALGLNGDDVNVQRAALMRLLEFPTAKALSVIKTDSLKLLPDLQEARIAVQKELESRALFPFLARGNGPAAENVFPSREGTGPMVSPDGKWIAYVETGWGRPGGSGGTGRSNLLSLTHVARSDGSSDNIVSDMFLVGWMSDSRRLGSARDGFATIVALNGKIVTEFGDTPDKAYKGTGFDGEVWPTGEARHQFGVRMPHSKGFQTSFDDPRTMIDFDYGEDAAFSPDGKWFGPRHVNKMWQFSSSEGNRFEIKPPDESSLWGSRAIWSPDGARVVALPVQPSNSFGDEEVETRKAFIIDFAGQRLKNVIEVDEVSTMGNWDYRKGRWNPWSRDGKRLAFIRLGQVWISDADGRNARQMTFDGSNKVFPTFSPDGSKVAYITWQYDNREHYTRLGPTDIWVVSCKTGLVTRVTRADPGRIESLDWLDDATLIFDRLEQSERHSTLRVVSLR